MSVRSQVVAAMSILTRQTPATWERSTGALGNAGFTPKGKPGGGVGSAHYFLSPISSVLLACAASVPSEAPDVVRRLEGLVAHRPAALLDPENMLASLPQPDVVAVGTTLRAYLEQQVTAWSAPDASMLALLADDPAWGSVWELEMEPDAPRARLHVHQGDKGWVTALFTSPEKTAVKWASVRRKITLSLPVLKVAGELLADSLARQPSIQFSTPETFSGGGDVTPGNETAVSSSPCQGTTDTAALRDQPTITELGTSQSHSAGERKKTQLGSDSCAGRSHNFQRSDPCARHRYAPAGAAA